MRIAWIVFALVVVIGACWILARRDPADSAAPAAQESRNPDRGYARELLREELTKRIDELSNLMREVPHEIASLPLEEGTTSNTGPLILSVALLMRSYTIPLEARRNDEKLRAIGQLDDELDVSRVQDRMSEVEEKFRRLQQRLAVPSNWLEECELRIQRCSSLLAELQRQ